MRGVGKIIKKVEELGTKQLRALKRIEFSMSVMESKQDRHEAVDEGKKGEISQILRGVWGIDSLVRKERAEALEAGRFKWRGGVCIPGPIVKGVRLYAYRGMYDFGGEKRGFEITLSAESEKVKKAFELFAGCASNCEIEKLEDLLSLYEGYVVKVVEGLVVPGPVKYEEEAMTDREVQETPM